MFLDNRIAGSWDALTIRLHEQSALDRWRQVEPVLAGVTDLEDLRRQLRPGTPRKRADELLGALVRLSAVDGHDDGDAVLLLHLLSEGAEVLAGRLADQAGDVVALVVGELTAQIRSFPWRRRTRAYAANLLLDTKAALWRELRPHRTRTFPGAGEVLVDPTDAWQVAGPAAAASASRRRGSPPARSCRRAAGPGQGSCSCCSFVHVAERVQHEALRRDAS
jgi:hypothetical protein